jgi:hypothetical protein
MKLKYLNNFHVGVAAETITAELFVRCCYGISVKFWRKSRKIMTIVSAASILIVGLLMSGCQHNQALQTPSVKKISSPETAMETARAYLDTNKTDLSRHDMSKPEGIQEIQIQGKKAWRVSWKLNNFTGKGGQLIVIVTESGKCEQGWGE